MFIIWIEIMIIIILVIMKLKKNLNSRTQHKILKVVVIKLISIIHLIDKVVEYKSNNLAINKDIAKQIFIKIKVL